MEAGSVVKSSCLMILIKVNNFLPVVMVAYVVGCANRLVNVDNVNLKFRIFCSYIIVDKICVYRTECISIKV